MQTQKQVLTQEMENFYFLALAFSIRPPSKANPKGEVAPFCLSNIAQYGLILKLIRGEAKYVLKFHSYPPLIIYSVLKHSLPVRYNKS